MTRVFRPATFLATALLTLLCAPHTSAQGVFDPIHLPVGNGVLNVTVGDIDADGLPDIAATGSVIFVGSGAHVFRNLDGFRFAAPVFYAGGTSDVLLADVNADGYADLMQAAPGSFSEHITVSLNLGDGTFGAPVNYSVAAGPADLHAVDVNEDGIVDLVVSCEFDIRVTVLLGVGDGTFLSPSYYGPTGDRPRALALGDLNGDDHLDLAVANTFDTTVSVMLGAGDGTFGTPLSPNLTGPSPEDIVIADFNEDGDADVAVIESSTGLMRVLFGDGDGTFTGEVTIVAGSVAEELVAVDFNEDGHVDLAGTSGAKDRVTVALGNGDGTFAAPRGYGTARDPFTLAVTDFNQDGDLDLVTGNVLGDNLTVMFGGGDGTFSPTLSTGDTPRGSAVSGDSLFVTNLLSNNVSVFGIQDDGRLVPGAVYPAGPDPMLVMAEDVTGDSIVDMVVGSEDFSGPGAQVLPGIGDGTFGAAQPQHEVMDEVRWMDLADLNGDGSLDLVITRDGIPGLLVNLNNGSGGFTASQVISTDGFLEGLDAVDLVGDALPDLVVGRNSFPAQIQVFENLGTGFAAPIVTILTVSGMSDLVVADVNGDLLPDAISLSESFNKVRVQFGNGDGTFGAETVYATGSDPVSVALGDMDDDGVLDIVTANRVNQFDTSSISLFLGVGDGTFSAPQTVTMGEESAFVTVADFDHDGVDDVAVSVSKSDHVAVLYSQAGPWTVLTHGLARTHGIPRQVGTGTMIPGQPYEFSVRDALENVAAAYFVGLSAIDAPFKGGTLVPFPLLHLSGLMTDANGEFSIAGAWPPGASGATIYLQFWVHDPIGPVAFSATNAVSATIP